MNVYIMYILHRDFAYVPVIDGQYVSTSSFCVWLAHTCLSLSLDASLGITHPYLTLSNYYANTLMISVYLT